MLHCSFVKKSENQFEKTDDYHHTLRIETVDHSLTDQLNQAFDCCQRFIVTEVFNSQEKNYNPQYHKVYHFSMHEPIMLVTAMMLKKEEILLPRFRSFYKRDGGYSFWSPQVERLEEEATDIRKIQYVFKGLLLETNRYRLLHATGVIR
mgnify:CR=1 FL=1